MKKGTKVILQLPLKKVHGTCCTTSNTLSLAAKKLDHIDECLVKNPFQRGQMEKRGGKVAFSAPD